MLSTFFAKKVLLFIVKMPKSKFMQPYNSSKTQKQFKKQIQNSFCESLTWRRVRWKDQTELNAHCAMTLYPVFEDENSNGSDEKLV